MQISPNWLAGFGESLGQRQHVRLHLALRAVDGKVAEVLRSAEATGHDQRVVVLGAGFAQVLDFAAGDTRGLDQDIAAFRHFLAGQVVDHMVLGDVRREALCLGATLAEAEQGDHAFVDFRAIVDATTGEDDGNFLVHEVYSLGTQDPDRTGLAGVGIAQA